MDYSPNYKINTLCPYQKTVETVADFIWGGSAPKSLQIVTTALKLKDTPWKESYDQPR